LRGKNSCEITHLLAGDSVLNGRFFLLKDKSVLNFGSYSYLGLETDERLKAAAIDAIVHHGMSYASSRAYLSNPLYAELEHELTAIFGTSVVFFA